MYHNIEEIYYQHEKELAQEGFIANIGKGIKNAFDKFIKWWKEWYENFKKKIKDLMNKIKNRKVERRWRMN